jgi:hypothetical protein
VVLQTLSQVPQWAFPEVLPSSLLTRLPQLGRQEFLELEFQDFQGRECPRK